MSLETTYRAQTKEQLIRELVTLRKEQEGFKRGVEKGTAELTGTKGRPGVELRERKKAMKNRMIYQERLRSLISEISLAEERERRRIATYLHDNIGHALTVANMKLESMRNWTYPANLVASIEEVLEVIKSLGQAVRSVTFELSPPVLYELGLVEAVDWLAERFSQQHGIQCVLDSDDAPKPMDDCVRVLLFHAIRELLMNVAKHARASHAKISISRDKDSIQVLVEDDGIGFKASRLDTSSDVRNGFGLFNIRERINAVGGHMNIQSRTGNGTGVNLVAPLKGLKETIREHKNYRS
jgi:signal transduction histidine kinase